MGDVLTEGCNLQTKYKGRVTQSTISLANYHKLHSSTKFFVLILIFNIIKYRITWETFFWISLRNNLDYLIDVGKSFLILGMRAPWAEDAWFKKIDKTTAQSHCSILFCFLGAVIMWPIASSFYCLCFLL